MKILKKSSSRKSRGFHKWLKDYLQNSSVAGCAYYVTPGTRPKERIFWLAVHITSVIFVIVMTLQATLDYTSTPTVTTVETTSFPVQNIDFPGVAICGVNKISYREAAKLSEEIMGCHKGGNFTRREITDMLKYLGHLYLFELNENEVGAVELLHKLLTRRYKSYVPSIVKELNPPCHSMLQWCSWGGKELACDAIFSFRKTGDGFCCTFNYARQSDDFGGQNTGDETLSTGGIERSQAVGLQYGLTVLLRADQDDHHYKILPVLGYKILIFAPLDYPDASSGSLREILVSPRTESSLTLQAATFYSVEEVSRYDLAHRNCLFSNEQSYRFGGYYSYSDCIMYCRISDILKFCKCIPFFYPTPMDGVPVRTCNLQDLRCLKKYRNRWSRVMPRFEKPMAPFEDTYPNSPQGVLNCSDCLPACADIGYQVSVSSAPLKGGTVLMGKESLRIDNHSIVNIFFRRPGTIRLKQDVMFYWYEIMSNYGGICGFFLGISLISIVELFYFFTLRLYKRKDNKEEEGSSRWTFVKAAKPSLRPLYWDEMIQPNVKY